MEHLIIIHGALGARDHMEPIGDQLKDNFHIHYLELDGHGEKADQLSKFSMDHFIDQLNELIDSIESDTIHIFGYSMGGFVALLSASRGQKKITSLFTLGTKLKWSPEIAAQQVRQLDPDKIEEKVPAFAQSLAKKHGAENWKELMRKTADSMQVLGDNPPITRDAMSVIQFPVHLCVGDQDEMVSKEETQEVGGFLPNGVFSQLDQTRHPIETANIPQLVERIKEFISSQQ